ncbi:MAG: hypothetical protein KatS3mg118_0817 [Paracoccaceae bacterium]|nr:MAG: hypothetical protein KatS3mg118_0817 [Paracoccaceae bacterium]
MSLRLFESQRFMRDRLRAALRRGTLGVLDIGSSKIACLVLKVDPERLAALPPPGRRAQAGLDAIRVAGFANTQSRGVAMGEIAAMDEAERGIRTVLARAQRHAGERVDQVVVCFSGGEAAQLWRLGRGGAVAQGEVADGGHRCGAGRLRAARFRPGARRDRMPSRSTSRWIIAPALSDPRGQVGSRLAIDMHVLTVDAAPAVATWLVPRRCDLDLRRHRRLGLCRGSRRAGRGRAGAGRGLHRHGAGGDLGLDLPAQHMICRPGAAGRRPCHPGHRPGPSPRRWTAERVKTLRRRACRPPRDDRELIELRADRRRGERGAARDQPQRR